jgi:hypothetical protein
MDAINLMTGIRLTEKQRRIVEDTLKEDNDSPNIELVYYFADNGIELSAAIHIVDNYRDDYQRDANFSIFAV